MLSVLLLVVLLALPVAYLMLLPMDGDFVVVRGSLYGRVVSTRGFLYGRVVSTRGFGWGAEVTVEVVANVNDSTPWYEGHIMRVERRDCRRTMERRHLTPVGGSWLPVKSM